MSALHNGLCRASAALCAIACAIAVPAAAQSAFDGVWQPIDPPGALVTISGEAPPLKPEFVADYAKHKAMLAAGDTSFDPTETRCAPPGQPRILTEDMPFEIVTAPDQIFFGYEWNRLMRLVPLADEVDVITPFYFGNSAGKIEGDTMTIRAEAFREGSFLDRSGLPHGEDLAMTETYTLSPDGSQMTATLQIEDPAVFTQPWQTQLHFARVPGGRIQEDICTLRKGLVPKSLQFFDKK